MNNYLKYLNSENIEAIVDNFIQEVNVNKDSPIKTRWESVLKKPLTQTREQKLNFLGLKKAPINIEKRINILDKKHLNRTNLLHAQNVDNMLKQKDFHKYVQNVYISKVIKSEKIYVNERIEHLTSHKNELEDLHKPIVTSRGFWARHFKIFRSGADKRYENHIKNVKDAIGQENKYFSKLNEAQQTNWSRIISFENKNIKALKGLKVLSNNFLAEKTQKQQQELKPEVPKNETVQPSKLASGQSVTPTFSPIISPSKI